MNESPSIAAIVHAGTHKVDATLISFVEDLKAQGWRVPGLVPGPTARPDDCAARTLLDLDTGTIYPISQNLGSGSTSCCLDPGALIAAAVVLHRARDVDADLIVVNRFGILEADGSGFAQEMLAFMAQGTPLLTVVSSAYLDAWRHFTGGLAQELAPDRDELFRWARTLPAARRCPLTQQAA